MNGAANISSIPPQKFAAKDGDGVVESNEEREVFGDETPADGDDADGTRWNGRRKEKDESPLGDAGAAWRGAEVEEHVEEDHAPHDGIPVRIGDAESEQETRDNGIDTEEVQPRLDKDDEHLTRRAEQERDRALRITVETKELMSLLVAQAACNPDDDIVKVAAPRTYDDEYDADECRKRHRHQDVVRYARHNALIMQKYKRHTQSEEEDREQRAHNDENSCLSCRNACMAQEHDLRHRPARCTRREEREKIIAEDHLYRLVQGDFFVGDLHKMHEAAAVEEHPKPDGK